METIPIYTIPNWHTVNVIQRHAGIVGASLCARLRLVFSLHSNFIIISGFLVNPLYKYIVAFFVTSM